MFKTWAENKTTGELHVVIGISEENVRRLKAGQPIRFPMHDIGLRQSGQILLMYGQTEQAIVDELSAAGIRFAFKADA